MRELVEVRRRRTQEGKTKRDDERKRMQTREEEAEEGKGKEIK